MPTVIDNLPAGESVVYYSGPSLANARQAAPVELADIAWQMAMRGEVDLAQRRLPDGRIAYLAVRRRGIDKSPVRPVLTVAYQPRKAA